MSRFKSVLFLLSLLAVLGWIAPARAQAPVIPCKVVAAYPHYPGSSTQGLFIRDGVFYESSGGYGRSFLAVVDPATGRHLKTVQIAPELFAEGIAPHGRNLRLLTWKSGIGHVYTLDRVLKNSHPCSWT